MTVAAEARQFTVAEMQAEPSMQRARKVLLVAYYFPPIAASGSMRPLGFCRYLMEYGWLPRVLCTDPQSAVPPQAMDEGLCDVVPEYVRIDCVPHPNPLRTLLNIREYMRRWFRTVAPAHQDNAATREGLGNCVGGASASRSTVKDLILDWVFSFPDIQCYWRRPAIRRLWNLPPAERPDLVYATGNPWTSFLVGKALARRFGVPLIVDFRDPWTLSPQYGLFSSSFLSRKAKRLERAVCRAAARIVLNTEELRVRFCTDYPEFSGKCVAITNGFDETAPLSPPPPAGQRGADRQSGADGSVLELCHFGAVYGDRSPKPLLQAVRQLLDERRVRAETLRLRFIGTWDVKDPECEELVAGLEKLGVVSREAPIPRRACLQQMARSRVLLVLQAGFPLQIPAKIYEYIAVGRPLLVIGGSGATANLVAKHRLGLCCENDLQAIKGLLLKLSGGGAEIRIPDTKTVGQFHYRALTGSMARLFDATCREQSSP